MIISAIILTFISFNSPQKNSVHHPGLSIKKDYECEILEKDFFIKDCYRNAVLNLDDKKMIAGMMPAIE